MPKNKCQGIVCKPHPDGRQRACNPETGRCKLVETKLVNNNLRNKVFEILKHRMATESRGVWDDTAVSLASSSKHFESTFRNKIQQIQRDIIYTTVKHFIDLPLDKFGHRPFDMKAFRAYLTSKGIEYKMNNDNVDVDVVYVLFPKGYIKITLDQVVYISVALNKYVDRIRYFRHTQRFKNMKKENPTDTNKMLSFSEYMAIKRNQSDYSFYYNGYVVEAAIGKRTNIQRIVYPSNARADVEVIVSALKEAGLTENNDRWSGTQTNIMNMK